MGYLQWQRMPEKKREWSTNEGAGRGEKQGQLICRN